jgi:hypothetical protein
MNPTSQPENLTAPTATVVSQLNSPAGSASPMISSQQPQAIDLDSNNQTQFNIQQDGFVRGGWVFWRTYNVLQVIYCILIVVIGSVIYGRYAANTCIPESTHWLLGLIVLSFVLGGGSTVMLIVLPTRHQDPIQAMFR